MRILGIIPARFASTRFPGKPLADIAGRSMVERVYRQAEKASCLDRVVVATDDKRIHSHVTDFGGEAVLTSPDHPSGTDRCFEALQQMSAQFDYVINIQGDEPLIDPRQVDSLGKAISDGITELATLIKAAASADILTNPSEVKVVLNHRMEALYFSRQPIPFLRGVDPAEWHKHFQYFYHVGMYAYRSDILGKITALTPSPLEKAESLEQLRWLENGYRIKCEITDIDSFCVDTPEDLQKLLGLYADRLAEK